VAGFQTIGSGRFWGDRRGIERFLDAEYVKQHAFEISEGSRLRELLEGAFGPHLPDADGPHDVIVDFSAEKAHLIASRQWHPTQRVTKVSDGVRLAFRAQSLTPLVSWVLEWGPHARAIAPEALVLQVTHELDKARALYAR
jgi:predicted DNA-binding transcriptional regulator YafY